jgi:exodeoxyribonuclease VII small subunit
MGKKTEAQDLTYEQAFDELSLLVGELEKGELNLEDSLAGFERGQLLAARCNQLLEKAELKLRTLVPVGDEEYEEIDYKDE